MSRELDENANTVSPLTARLLMIIASAMGGGLVLVAGLIFLSFFNAADKVPTPREVHSINSLTTIMMILALTAIISSEFIWRGVLRRTPGSLSARVQTAYIARVACREAAGLLGMTVAYIAAISGVLRAYPAYWVNLAPFALFLGFLATHWPAADKLEAEARGVLESRH